MSDQDEPYTPSVGEARMAYGDARCIDLDDPAHAHGCPQNAEFDRMIARVRREAAAEALEWAADECWPKGDPHDPGCECERPIMAQDFRTRAAAIREQGNE